MRKARWYAGVMLLILGGIVLSGCRVSDSSSPDVDATIAAAVEETVSAMGGSNPTQIPGAEIGPPAPQNTRPPQQTQQPQDNIRRVTVAEAKALVDAGEAVIVDARVKKSYDEKHITGAISMPYTKVAERYTELPGDKLLVFY